MKKLIVSAISTWLFLRVGGAGADMTCDPGTMPRPGQFQVGLQGAWTCSQYFEDVEARITRGEESYLVAAKDIKVTDDRSFMVGLAYGVSDRFGVYAELGLKDGGTFHFSDWEADGGTWWSNEFDLKSVFAWGLGAKLRVFESREGLGLVLAARYQRYDDRETGDMEYPGPGVSRNDFKADYWQADVAAVVYQKLGPVIPYAGLGYEYAELTIAGRANLGTPYADHIDFGAMNSDDGLNAVVGLGWRPAGGCGVTLQGDFITRTAVALGVNYAF
ncbi:MAG TPA: hypothetical protein PLZ73_04995 [bacterium]|mgnify:FL=1|nr:hypothetical protein [bacterium]